MPSFLDSMQQKADQVRFELDKRNRIGAVQHQIDDLQRQINGTVSQIGTQAVDLHRQNQLPVAALVALCQIVIEHEAQIAAFQAQIDAIRAEVMLAPAAYSPAPLPPSAAACPNCGQSLLPGARFCPNCGLSLAVAPPPSVAYEPGPPCPSCGVPTVKDAAFCNECGCSLNVPVSPPVPTSALTPPTDTAASAAYAPVSPPLTVLEQLDSPTLPDLGITDVTTPVGPIELPPPAEANLPFCPNCGARQRRADARFCPVCGQNIASPTIPDPAAQEPPDESVS